MILPLFLGNWRDGALLGEREGLSIRARDSVGSKVVTVDGRFVWFTFNDGDKLGSVVGKIVGSADR